MTSKHSIDGFVPRRPGSQLGDHHRPERSLPRVRQESKPEAIVAPAPRVHARAANEERTSIGVARGDISESLKGIETIELPPKNGKNKNKKAGKPKSKKRRIIKWVIIALIAILLAIGGWIVYRGLNATGNVFKGNILDIVQNTPLKQDANGRSNVLIVGTSEDDPGHDAGYLTDSMMVVSVDQNNKNAYMISIPRDLEVKYGEACISGYQGKINAYYNCVGGGTGEIDADREALTKESAFVGELLGMEIQYGVNVNYTVMRELVSAVGGITVTIESRDPRGQMDSNFDWKCGVGDRKVTRAQVLERCPPSGHYIDYPNGPVNLDAEHALYLAQARGDIAPTYGFEQSNFDREKNQQKIVKAIREKALSAGVLANPTKVTGVIDALGNNMRTTFESKEVGTLISLAKDIKSEDIQSISLIDGDNPVMGGDAQPTAGRFQFSDIQALIKKKLSSDPVVREEAKIVVLNGSGVAGVGMTEATKLEEQGFTISNVDNAPDGTYGDVEIYKVGDGKTGTKAKLESLYGVKVKTTTPPVGVAEGTNFVVIFGKDRSPAN